MNRSTVYRYTLLWAGIITVSSLGFSKPTHLDERGWNQGTPALQANQYARPFDPVAIELPEKLRTRIARPTVLYYFSPACPHCKDVAKEMNQLHKQISESTDIIGIASGHRPRKELDLYLASFPPSFPVIYDKGKDIASAIGVRSTPSALLVHPEADGRIVVHDFWYPYRSGYDVLIEMRVGPSPWMVFKENKYLLTQM